MLWVLCQQFILRRSDHGRSPHSLTHCSHHFCFPTLTPLTPLHTQPDDPEEMARITAWGGFVCPPAEVGLSARVYLDPGFTMIGLAMARSIGESLCDLLAFLYAA